MKKTDKTIWSATPTPFLANGALDAASVEKLVEHHVAMGVAGLFLAGTCGEGPFMPNGQRIELVRLVKRLAGSRLRLAVQVSDTSVARVIENLRAAEDAGADTVVIAPPWLPRFCNRDFARRYFVGAIEAASAPVGLYVLAQPPETGIDPELWSEVAAHPKIRLLKDSSVSETNEQAFAAIRRQRKDLLLLTGNEFNVIRAIEAGYDGGLLGTGILIAGFIRRALAALAAGDRAAAEAWQRRANDFMYDLFGRNIGLWLGGLKYALFRLGLFATEQMHLNYPLTAADRTRIDAALAREAEYLRPPRRC
jgi:2-dehydro-3-deoxy-D-pentonate aldolase